MERTCPQCLSVLTVSSSDCLVCPGCQEQYHVLFSRTPVVPAVAPIPVAPIAAGPAVSPQQNAGPAQPPAVAALPERISTRCPSCGKRLKADRASIGKQGRCACGTTFRIEPCDDKAAEAPVPGQASCAFHPAVAAKHVCSHCHTLMCDLCAMPGPGGTMLCPSCAIVRPMSAPAPRPVASSWAPPVASVPVAAACRRHPAVQAAIYCESCRAPMCDTCTFSFPGGVYLCPDCATGGRTRSLGKRKVFVVLAFVLSGWSMLMIASMMVLMAGEASQDAAIIAQVFYFLGFVPGLIGMAMGISSFDRRTGNPGVVWGAGIFSVVVAAVWLLMLTVGVLMG